jgi:hypothetical protein
MAGWPILAVLREGGLAMMDVSVPIGDGSGDMGKQYIYGTRYIDEVSTGGTGVPFRRRHRSRDYCTSRESAT